MFCPSPNCDERPDTDIDLLVIHSISLPAGQYGGSAIEDLFCNRLDCSADDNFRDLAGLKVSSHLLIRRCGALIQFVPFSLRAWHAGKSCFEQRQRCNDFSIGIELEGTDSDQFTEQQYRVLAQATNAIRERYPLITVERIVGHEHIAPLRKTDPGVGFDWTRYRAMLTTN